MNPILIERTRGEIVESFHTGSICIVDENGDIVFQIGDVNQVSFTRSALKLFQSVPLIETGAFNTLSLTNKELAITCGSHNAEKEHLNAVISILDKINLSPDYLKCGPQMPTGRIPRNEFKKNGLSPSDIHNNCSGKHAGFLALCKHLNLSFDDYLAIEHDIQVLIKETAAEFLELNTNDLTTGEDGCSAPNYAASLFHQAIGYKNLVSQNHGSNRNNACKQIIDACRHHPFMIAGSDRYCTEIIEASNGEVIGKTGADGVFCVAFPEKKWGCAIKIDDGKMGPQYLVAHAIINALGIKLSNSLDKYISPPIKNWNKHNIGFERISTELNLALKAL